jgi:hypothetical protein
MPFDIQYAIWRSYFSNHVLNNIDVTIYCCCQAHADTYPPTLKWEYLRWYQHISYDSTVSGQRRIRTDYNIMWYPFLSGNESDYDTYSEFDDSDYVPSTDDSNSD